VLPVGISFFTFEGIAYAIDVYRRDLGACRSLLDFGLFIAFFPHLIAGPIIRPVNFFPQVGKAFALTDEDARWGLREILKGLFKKIALSNYFAPLRDACSTTKVEWPGRAGVDRRASRSLQIYFDFSGYTDIARGCARLLGYRFPPTSRARTRDRHRRILAPLACFAVVVASRLSGPRSAAIAAAKLAHTSLDRNGPGGLWHGASWDFAVWGPPRRASDRASSLAARVVSHRVEHDRSPGPSPLWVAMTFVLVTLGWFPSARGFRDARDSCSRFCNARHHSGRSTPGDHRDSAVNPRVLPDRPRPAFQDWLVERARFHIAVAASVVAVLALKIFGRIGAIPFVYFQFKAPITVQRAERTSAPLAALPTTRFRFVATGWFRSKHSGSRSATGPARNRSRRCWQWLAPAYSNS
jgi:hypothetical protein